MKSPFTSRRPAADADGFYATGIAAQTIAEGEMGVVTAGKKKAIITRANGELVAFSNLCPHAAADLSDGRLARGQIKCPDHGYTFDVRSGRATWPEGEGCRLFSYQLKIKEGEIYVRP